MHNVTVVDNKAQSRYEAEIDGSYAFAEYIVSGDSLVFTHTEVPTQFRGQGIGEAIAKFALDDARAKHMHVVPQCRFIAAFIEHHSEYQDLVKS